MLLQLLGIFSVMCGVWCTGLQSTVGLHCELDCSIW